MVLADRVGFRGIEEPVAGVVTDGLQEAVAGVRGHVVRLHEGLVNQPAEELENRVAVDDLIAAHRLGGIQRESAVEHRQASKQRAFRFIQQVVAPCDGGLQGLLTRLSRLPTPRQQAESILEGSGDGGRPHDAGTGSGEFDGQWKTIEAFADR